MVGYFLNQINLEITYHFLYLSFLLIIKLFLTICQHFINIKLTTTITKFELLISSTNHL